MSFWTPALRFLESLLSKVRLPRLVRRRFPAAVASVIF
jgi:hypothetical protein